LKSTVIAAAVAASIALMLTLSATGIQQQSSQVLAQGNGTNQTAAPPVITTGTPILGGVANLEVTRNSDNQLTVEVTKASVNNETTVISQNGTVTVVPGGNVTVIDNNTVVVAPPKDNVTTTPTNVTIITPDNQTVTTTPSNVTVVDPALPKPCGCNQTNNTGGNVTQPAQPQIPPVTIIPAPGQNVTTQEPIPAPIPLPQPPATNVTGGNTTAPTNPPFVPNAGNTTNTNGTGQ